MRAGNHLKIREISKNLKNLNQDQVFGGLILVMYENQQEVDQDPYLKENMLKMDLETEADQKVLVFPQEVKELEKRWKK